MKNISILFVISLLTGCIALPIPHDRPVTPVYAGTVQDSGTNEPISNVLVTVESDYTNPKTGNPYNATTRTNADGYYEVGATEHGKWYFITLLPLEGYCSGKVTFTHPGYQAYKYNTRRFQSGALNGSCTQEKVERNVLLSREKSNN